MVLVVEREHIPPTPREQTKRTVHLAHLIQIEREVVDAMLERVRHRTRPTVANDALEDVRSHAAISAGDAASINAAASNPERHPSSWNP